MAHTLVINEMHDMTIPFPVSPNPEPDVSDPMKAHERFVNPHGRLTKWRASGLNELWICVEVPFIIGVIEKRCRQ